MPLHQKETYQDQTGQGNHVPGSGIGGHIKSFNGRKHRDGRSNDPVAIQEGRASSGQYSESCPLIAIFFQLSLQGGKERKDTAFSLVVGLHDENDIFETLSLIHISEPTRRTPISYA